LLQRGHDQAATSHNDVRCERDQFDGIFASFCGIAGSPTNVYAHIAAFAPTPLFKRFSEGGITLPTLGILNHTRHEHADASHPFPLLRPRYDRPRHRAAEPRNELPPKARPIDHQPRQPADN
jgi:hypothetical protein